MSRGSDIPAGPLSLPGASLPVIRLSAMTVPVALVARAYVFGRRRIHGLAERAVHIVRDRHEDESVFAVTLAQCLAQFLDEAGLPGRFVPLRAPLPCHFEHRVRVHLTLLGLGNLLVSHTLRFALRPPAAHRTNALSLARAVP